MNRGTPHHGATAWQVMEEKPVEKIHIKFTTKSFKKTIYKTQII